MSKGIFDLYIVMKNSAETAYEITKGLTKTLSDEAAVAADRAIRLNDFNSGNYQKQADGTYKVTLDNYQDDQSLLDLIDAVHPPEDNTLAKPDRYKENGVKVSGSSSTFIGLLGIGTGVASSDGAKFKTIVTFNTLDRESGSFGTKPDDWSKPTIALSGMKTEFDLTIAAALFDPTFWDATAIATEIPKVAQFAAHVTKFCTKAT
jgi:hypothetical protein